MFKSESGFTLIELLVAVAIIGILASIGVIHVTEHRIRAFNAQAQSDLRNAITAQESVFTDTDSYESCVDAGCNDPVLPGFQMSANNTLTCSQLLGGSAFQCIARHNSGDTTYAYDSSTMAWTATP